MKIILTAAAVGMFLVGPVGLAAAGHGGDSHRDWAKKDSQAHKVDSHRAVKRLQDNPFKDIQQKIDALQAQLDAMQQTPGPRGPQGPVGAAGAVGPSGPQGPQGFAGADGLSCWDLNGNFNADPEEDVNDDGTWDALDCQGQGSGTSSVPAIWSGYCTAQGSLLGWNQYCANGEDFSTADNYLTVAADGTFTALVPGFYRINAWTASNVADWAMRQLVVNGVQRHFGFAYSGGMWIDNSMDLIWPLNAGDTFHVDFYNPGGNSYAFRSGDANGKNSKLQVSFVGPLQ